MEEELQLLPIDLSINENNEIYVNFPEGFDGIINSIELINNDSEEDLIIYCKYLDFIDDELTEFNEELCNFPLGEVGIIELELVLTPEMNPRFTLSTNAEIKFLGFFGPKGCFENNE